MWYAWQFGGEWNAVLTLSMLIIAQALGSIVVALFFCYRSFRDLGFVVPELFWPDIKDSLLAIVVAVLNLLIGWPVTILLFIFVGYALLLKCWQSLTKLIFIGWFILNAPKRA